MIHCDTSSLPFFTHLKLYKYHRIFWIEIDQSHLHTSEPSSTKTAPGLSAAMQMLAPLGFVFPVFPECLNQAVVHGFMMSYDMFSMLLSFHGFCKKVPTVPHINLKCCLLRSAATRRRIHDDSVPAPTSAANLLCVCLSACEICVEALFGENVRSTWQIWRCIASALRGIQLVQARVWRLAQNFPQVSQPFLFPYSAEETLGDCL